MVPDGSDAIIRNCPRCSPQGLPRGGEAVTWHFTPRGVRDPRYPQFGSRGSALSKTHSRLLQAVIGTGLGIGCLWIVLQWADIDEVRTLLRGADVSLLGLALTCYLADLAVRALRWHALMPAKFGMRYRDVLTALLVGYAVNNVLPARLGELFRAEFCKRRYGVSGTAALGSIILERLLDGVMVLSVLTMGFLLVDKQGSAADTIRQLLMLGAGLGVLGFFAVWVVLDGGVRARLKAPQWVTARLDFLEESLHVIRTPAFVRGLALTLPVWVLESVAIWLVMRAFHFDLDPAALMCLVGVASLSTLLPSAPGYMGSYHAAYALIMVFVGSTVSAGVAAATSVQLFLLLPVTALGLLMLLYLSLIIPLVKRR